MSIDKIIPRYRTIKQCLAEIKKLDPDTCISEWYIRQLCKNGEIVCHGSGNKSLVSLDSLLEYLNRSLEEINNQKAKENINE